MRTRILLELCAAAGCTIAGTELWRADGRAGSRGQDRGLASTDRRAATVAAPALAAAHDRIAAATESSAARESGVRDGAVTPDAGVELAAGASIAAHPTRPRPRASSAATAPLPPVAGPSDPRVPEALARVALRFVGRDAGADALWATAIDDPFLPEGARSDLIEDLNDEGYADPNQITPADLPLILARLRIIERLAPRAKDEVNAAAFAEAYKDLVNMLVRLRGSAADRR